MHSRLQLHPVAGADASCGAFILSALIGEPTDSYKSIQAADGGISLAAIIRTLERAGFDCSLRSLQAPSELDWKRAGFERCESEVPFNLQQMMKYFRGAYEDEDIFIVIVPGSKAFHAFLYDNWTQSAADNGRLFKPHFKPLAKYRWLSLRVRAYVVLRGGTPAEPLN